MIARNSVANAHSLYTVTVMTVGTVKSFMTFDMWARHPRHCLSRCLDECGGEGSVQVIKIEAKGFGGKTSEVVDRKIASRSTAEVIAELEAMGVAVS